MKRATCSLVGGAVLAVLLPAAPAWAHAEFVGTSTVPTGAARVVILKVPEERGADLHHTTVVVDVPADFGAVSCQTKPGWQCGAIATPAGGAIVTFTRTAAMGGDALFRATLLTPDRPGDYAFKVSQTYGDGKVVSWDGTPRSNSPAPVLTVVAGAAPAQPASVSMPVPVAAAPASAAEAARGGAAAAPATTPPPPTTAAAPISAAAPEAEAGNEDGDAAATLPRTGPARGLLASAGAAIALGGAAFAAAQRRGDGNP